MSSCMYMREEIDSIICVQRYELQVGPLVYHGSACTFQFNWAQFNVLASYNMVQASYVLWGNPIGG